MDTNIFIHVSVVQILLDKWEKICLVYVTNMKKKNSFRFVYQNTKILFECFI